MITNDYSQNEDVSPIKMGTINSDLPEKSKKKYEMVFKSFMDWRIENKTYSYSEDVLLTYFGELAKKYKSSSLWSHYSMLKSTLNINEGINIENYHELRRFLKQNSEGFQPKKSRAFTSEEINRFINEAPDEKFLATKVGVIMGVMGACRKSEMHAMKTGDLEDLEVAFLVSVPNKTTKTVRKFTITDNFYTICKKYIQLRPSTINTDGFFYHKNLRIGINKFSFMWKQIALFLNLPHPEEYSAQSFRGSTSRLYVKNGCEITPLIRHMGFGTTTVTTENSNEITPSETENYHDEQIKIEDAEDNIDELIKPEIVENAEDYMDELIEDEVDPDVRIPDGEKENATSNKSTNSISINNGTFRFDVNSAPILHFTNCSNINIYFENRKVS